LPLAAGLLVIAGITWWQLRGTSQALGEADVVLIADFRNTTGDPVFDGTLKQALAVKLEESPFLNVLPDQRVRETLAFMNRPQDTPVTQAVAREICQRQGIKAAILGDIASLGSTYVVTLTAENCHSGDVLAREQATAAGKEQVLASIGVVASSIRGRLGESLASIARNDKPIDEATTSSLEALKAFSLGDEKRNTGSDEDAIPFFRRALELDPEFALAHARLGTVYSNRGQQALAVEHRTRAYELRERVSERERLYITAHYYNGVKKDVDKALETYDLWKQTYPRDPVPHINSGTLYAGRGDQARALDAYLKGLELDPRRRLAYTNAIGKLIDLDRLNEARQLVERQMQMLGESPETHHHLYAIAARQHDRAEMDRHAAALENSPMAASFLGDRAEEMIYYGRLRDARRLLTRQVELLDRQGLTDRAAIARSNQAISFACMGEEAAAREAAASVTGGNLDVTANVAFAYAWLGDAPRARRHFAVVEAAPLPDEGRRPLIRSTFEAVLALRTGRPRQAADQLAELRTEDTQTLVSNALLTRAEARRQTGMLAEAESDFRALLARKHPNPFVLLPTYAHIGLARTLAAAGNTAGARAEYQHVVDQWKDADTDFTIAKEVKTEAAKLGT
jgi:tetratricopeptide (TPR) repeat protein